MEEKWDVERVFQLLDGDKDVLLIGQDTFTVSRFKGLIEDELRRKFNSVKSLKTISPGNIAIGLDNIKCNYNQKGISAELLRVGSKEWEKGKVRIQSSIEIETDARVDVNVKVDIEFSPNEPHKPESPLDDLRELPEYKQQL
jgi:hypothetical protein